MIQQKHAEIESAFFAAGGRIRDDGRIFNATVGQRIVVRSTVDPESGCWIWQGNTDRGGYGRLTIDRKKVLAHRASYIEFVGPIPSDMTIDHLCFNPPCCNPDHLRLLALSENARRQRSALSTTCAKGHVYDEGNLLLTEGPGGRRARRCKQCVRANDLAWRDRQARRLQNGDLSHGARRAYDAGCRCDPCRQWRHDNNLQRTGRPVA